MAKKKQQKTVPLSPEKYIRTKARNLPIVECLISEDWQEEGLAQIIVARQHKSGNYTFGMYLVDLYCLGVKDTFYQFNIDVFQFNELKQRVSNEMTSIELSYNEAHNIIYGAVAYAEDLGFNPHKNFNVSQYILEEDSDDIPLIEYEYGRNGKPFLIVDSKKEADRYVPVLKNSVGDDFEILIQADDFDDDFNDESEEMNELEKSLKTMMNNMTDEERSSFIDNMDKMMERIDKSNSLPHTEYAYKYPEYPIELKLNHPEMTVFYEQPMDIQFKEEVIKSILSLPRKTLVEDLEQIILTEIGKTYKDIPDELWESQKIFPLTHALLFLGELRAEESLNVVLEIMRQNEDFMDFHFGDFADRYLDLTLYYIGKNQLPQLLSFAKEPDLYIYLKLHVLNPVAQIAIHEPERRNEVIEWFRELLGFLTKNVHDTKKFDANFSAFAVSKLLDIQPTEVIPEIKALYETNLVDEMVCGDINMVLEEIKAPRHKRDILELKNIYERYEELLKIWQ